MPVPDPPEPPRRFVAVADTIHRLAAAQHGVVTRRQLLDAGVSRHRIDQHVRARWLRPVHPGVYRVGPIAAPAGPLMAAYLACGGEAVVSHQSAAALWRIPEGTPPPTHVHVSTGGGQRVLRSVRAHRVRSLRPNEVTRLDGIPVTTPARTLLDLAGTAPARFLEQALEQALARRIVTADELRALVRRHRGRRGVRRLRELLEAVGEAALTRSEAERRFLELVRRAQLPAPRANVRLEAQEVDFLWRRERLVVEVDGYAFHSSPHAFETDRRRDARLLTAGYRVLRVTWSGITRKPEATIADVARALGAAAGLAG